jgi:hypothetical protein
MIRFYLSCLFCLFHTALSAGSLRGPVEGLPGVSCCLRVAESVVEDKATGKFRSEKKIACETNQDDDPRGVPSMMYKIDLPSDFTAEHRAQIDGGQLCIHVPGGFIEIDKYSGDYIVIPQEGANVTTVEPSNYHRRRTESRSTGVSSVLVVLVNTPYNIQPTTAKDVSNYIFGSTSPTVKTVFHDCSQGAKTIVPATGPGITDGVASMTFDFDVARYNLDSAVNIVVGKTEGKQHFLLQGK